VLVFIICHYSVNTFLSQCNQVLFQRHVGVDHNISAEFSVYGVCYTVHMVGVNTTFQECYVTVGKSTVCGLVQYHVLHFSVRQIVLFPNERNSTFILHLLMFGRVLVGSELVE